MVPGDTLSVTFWEASSSPARANEMGGLLPIKTVDGVEGLDVCAVNAKEQIETTAKKPWIGLATKRVDSVIAAKRRFLDAIYRKFLDAIGPYSDPVYGQS